MTVLELLHWRIDPDHFTGTVQALVEGDDGPFFAKASFALAELEDWPNNDKERLAFIEALKLDWTFVNDSF